MAHINITNVSVDLPIYGAHNMNLKGRVANFMARRETEIEIIRALDDITLSIQDGARIGIVGPNGAGKTTLLRVMAGILRPTKGTVEIQGSVVSMIDQGLGMDPQCTGIENIFRRGIFLNQSTHQMQDKLDEIIEFSGLGDRIRHPLYTYSSGMRARLAFSIATSVKPEILIIDEGIGAADEEFAERAATRLEEFLQNAGILLLASHSNQLIESWCNKKVRLESGHLLSKQH
jgi:ABC-type polysaccharide/polyol phosphate transport system ATPase subunit